MDKSRRQPGMLEGLSRFLVQHERCGAGFDVAHPAGLGSGRVSITCRGCGARHEYATATIEFEREVTIRPGEPPAEAGGGEQRPRIPPRPSPYPDSEPEPEAAPARAETEQSPTHRQLPVATTAGGGAAEGGPAARHGFWSSPRTTVALLAVTAIAILIAVLQLLGGNGGTQRTGTQTAPTTAATPPPRPGPAAQPTSAPPTVTLRTSLFRLGLPRGWSSRKVGGSLLLDPGDGGRVNVQVYFQSSPRLSESLMARKTARFLRREVPGAGIYPRRVEIAGRSVEELTARGPGETAIAVNVLRGPYRYLLVRRIFAGAKPQVSQAAGRIVRSFRLN